MIMKRFTWPAELTLNLIGGKWKALILHRLLEGESRRFGELKRLLPGISAKMLAKHLKELEFDGLITRLEIPARPSVDGRITAKPRIVYTPTGRSRTLSPILEAIQSWGRNHLEEYGETPAGPLAAAASAASAGSVASSAQVGPVSPVAQASTAVRTFESLGRSAA
jgi:DNA-binding HxlR family transcriptional regulator